MSRFSDSARKGARGLRRIRMALKPDARTAYIREQTILDLPSGLTLHFEACEGGTRLVMAGRALRYGDREILFDEEGLFSRIGPSLKKLPM